MTRTNFKSAFIALFAFMVIADGVQISVFAQTSPPSSQVQTKVQANYRATKPAVAKTATSQLPQSVTNSATNSSSSVSSNARDIDRVVAIVNRDVVTQQELNDRVAMVNRQFKEAKKPAPPSEELERLVLERLILEHIQVQEAKNRNYKVSEEELDGIIANMATQKKMSLPEYKASLQKQGVAFTKYREELLRDILISRFREREVDSKIKVSDADVDNFIADRQRLMGVEAGGSATSASSQDSIHLAQILIPLLEGATATEISRAREKAQQILTQAQFESDFVVFANRLSTLDKSIRIQDLGLRTADRLPTLFLEATQELSAGQFASIVQSAAGLHILKVVDKKSAKQTALKATVVAGGGLIVPQSDVRHILIRVRPGQNEEDIARRLMVFRDQVRSKVVDFGALAKKHSEDPQSAPNDGALGWVTPGQLMPEFEQVMASMQPGQVSDPVRTEYGWHLIQLLNRKQTELTAVQQKDFARANLRQAKLEQAQQDWVRELRDAATVEYREPYSAPK